MGGLKKKKSLYLGARNKSSLEVPQPGVHREDLAEPAAQDPHPEKEQAGAGIPTCSADIPVPERRKAAGGTITTNLWPG